MTTSSLKPEDVFSPEDLAVYESRFNRLWFHLVNAHESAYVVDRIRAFPFHLFASPDRERFFTLVLFNFTRQIALTVINALTDTTRGVHTFEALQAWILERCRTELIRNQVASLFTEMDRESLPDTELLRRARRFRHNVAAHFNLRHAEEPALMGLTGIPLGDCSDPQLSDCNAAFPRIRVRAELWKVYVAEMPEADRITYSYWRLQTGKGSVIFE